MSYVFQIAELHTNRKVLCFGKTRCLHFLQTLKWVKLHTILEGPRSIHSLVIVQKESSNHNKLTASLTLRSGSRSTICISILSLKVVNQHTKFEEPRFILSQDIVRKPRSSENSDLENSVKATIYNPILPPPPHPRGDVVE